MTIRVGLLRLTLACWVPLLAGCAALDHSGQSFSIQSLADEYLAAFLDRYPETGTYYGIPGQRHDRLNDNSSAALARWQAREDAWLARIRQLDTDVSPRNPDWAIHGIQLETLEAAVAKRVCRDELWAVSETAGWQTDVAYIAEIQPVGGDDARRQALTRARDLARYLDTEIVNLKQGLRLGYSAPKRNVGLVAGQVRALLEPDSPLLSPARRDGDPAFQSALSGLFEQEVRPALRRYLDFLEAEYAPAARSAIAVAENPGGAECYRAAIRHHSTLELTPLEIHDLGVRQMAEIQAEMREIAARAFDTDDLPVLLKRLTTDPEFAFSSRQEIIDYSEAALARAKEAMPHFFGIVPRSDVVIEPYPAFREDSGTGEYQSPAEDGSRPGLYYIPVNNPQQRLAGHRPRRQSDGRAAVSRPADLHAYAAGDDPRGPRRRPRRRAVRRRGDQPPRRPARPARNPQPVEHDAQDPPAVQDRSLRALPGGRRRRRAVRGPL